MSESIFALVDCNNFFCSCERVFSPKLEKVPLAVLSNNDGCIIARSQEVKDLGIPMGAPFHQYKKIIEDHNVHVVSCNFQLYGDMSNRVMSTLSRFSPQMEVYSVDEAFLKLNGMERIDLLDYIKEIRQTVLQWTGIPVSIGIAPTKTLAKVANHIAKKQTNDGVFDIRPKLLQQEILARFPIEDLWGVGRNLSKKFRLLGIGTAGKLREVDTKWIRQHYTVVGEKLIRELNGLSCLDLSEIKPRKNIISSKSFGYLVTNKEEIFEAIANYTARACEKMRAQNSKAKGIYVYIRTNHFMKSEKQYRNSATIGFPIPLADTTTILKAARQCFDQIYKSGYRYKKAGIMLYDLIADDYVQQDFFANHEPERRMRLMKTIDEINFFVKRGVVGMAAQGTKKPWLLKCELRTPRYTTNWNELVEVSG
jgi:DNA polymerase V